MAGSAAGWPHSRYRRAKPLTVRYLADGWSRVAMAGPPSADRLSCQNRGLPVPMILSGWVSQIGGGFGPRRREEGAMKLQDERLFRQHCYIDGEWVDAISRETIRVTNPANGETLGAVPKMGAEETRRAIEAADRALPAWRAKTAKERAQILRRWFDLLMANQEDLGALMTAEQGKPLAEAKGEIAYAASFIEWFGEEGKRVYGDTIPSHGADKRIVVIKEPIGVCAAITPWNFPAAMITRKCGPALAAGCTMVLKPASATPYSAIASKYRNAGQTCVCANRILVQDGVYDAFTKRLAEAAGAMKVADGFEPGAVIGPLIDMKAVEKVEAHIGDALKKGAKIVIGGKR